MTCPHPDWLYAVAPFALLGLYVCYAELVAPALRALGTWGRKLW